MKLGGILENFRDDKQAYLSLEKISRMPITDYDYPDKELNACLCLTIKNFLKSKLKDIDPSNLKEFSTAQQEIREIEEEAKNY